MVAPTHRSTIQFSLTQIITDKKALNVALSVRAFVAKECYAILTSFVVTQLKPIRAKMIFPPVNPFSIGKQKLNPPLLCIVSVFTKSLPKRIQHHPPHLIWHFITIKLKQEEQMKKDDVTRNTFEP